MKAIRITPAERLTALATWLSANCGHQSVTVQTIMYFITLQRKAGRIARPDYLPHREHQCEEVLRSLEDDGAVMRQGRFWKCRPAAAPEKVEAQGELF